MLRYFAVFSWFSLVLSSPCFAASAKEALGLLPIQRGDVTMDEVSEEEVERCRLERIEGPEAGYEVYSPDNVLLRRFLDSNNDRKLDVWSYFANGVEVYRDIDSDFNGKADQYRWLGTAGCRWGMDDNEDTVIDRWKEISAQEVSAEIVASLAKKDSTRFNRLLPSTAEIKSLDLAEELEKKLTDRVARAAKDFTELAATQKAVSPSAHWTHFSAAAPGVIVAGSQTAKADLLVHEGVLTMFESDGKSGQIFVGTLVRTANGWRLADLPNPVAEGQPVTEVAGVFFSGRAQANAENAPRPTSGADALVAELEKIDRQLASEKSPQAKSKLHLQRAETLEKIAAAASQGDRDIWLRQLIDTVATAVYGGEFLEGRTYMRDLTRKVRQLQPELEAFAAYQAMFTEYMMRQAEPNAELAKVQEWWLQELQGFVSMYEKSPESAEALRQLGFNSELENKEDAAKKWYRQAATKFPNSEAGRKSDGAFRRLESVGRPLTLKGAKLEGGQFDLQSLRGSPVVIQFWATWCEPCKQDMRMLKTLQSRYRDRKLAVVGVNLDESREAAARFLKENPVGWTQLFEEGGLENSRLSTELGIQTLPMMLLIDSSGKVVRHSILAAELDAAISELK